MTADTENPGASSAAGEAIAQARAAIEGLGPQTGLLVLAANGLDGHKPTMAIELARSMGYEPVQARTILMRATTELARRHRGAFDALVTSHGPDRPASVASDPWYRFAVHLTRGSLSRWAR